MRDFEIAGASPEPLVRTDALTRAVASRQGRPLTVVDLSMPPVVEPGEVPGVTRVDLGALEQQVASQRDRRAGEVPKVEAVIVRTKE